VAGTMKNFLNGGISTVVGLAALSAIKLSGKGKIITAALLNS
jgi:hypothetical protein